MKRTDWLVVLAIVLCALGLIACGGGAGEGTGAGGGSASVEEAGLEFAECMRGHGVEMEDPKPGQNITIPDDEPTTKNALAACDGKLADAGRELSAEEGEEFREGWLAFTGCMREQGIDLADPRFPGAGKVLLGIAGVDTTSPAFEAAAASCEDEVPAQTDTGIGIGG
ncbi:MAG TPA: hypothetical protein VEW07_12260 [Solirubrobacterales bacterium]|nr:hypothetical protein [Solirubrobacterales bacterium]